MDTNFVSQKECRYLPRLVEARRGTNLVGTIAGTLACNPGVGEHQANCPRSGSREFWGIDHDDKLYLQQVRYSIVLPKYLEYLVDLGITREQRCAFTDHLRKDAANGPHVDSCRIVTRAKEDFWCSVPEGYHLHGTKQAWAYKYNNRASRGIT
jgi:hypothetical protein